MTVKRMVICGGAADGAQEHEIKARLARMLRERIDEKGVGYFTTRRERERFLDSLPPVERKRWAHLVVERRLIHVLRDVRDVSAHDRAADVRATYAPLADLVICREEHERLLHATLRNQPNVNPEITSLANLATTTSLSYDPQRVRLIVGAGEDRDAIFDERVRSLALHVERLTILDRYALSAVERSNETENGFKWLLRRVREVRSNPDPLKLELTMALERGVVDERLMAKVIESFGLRSPDPDEFKSITVRVANREVGRQHMHDRFFRFDGRVLDCGTGLGIFSERSVLQRAKLAVGSYEESDETIRLVESAASCGFATWKRNAEMW